MENFRGAHTHECAVRVCMRKRCKGEGSAVPQGLGAGLSKLAICAGRGQDHASAVTLLCSNLVKGLDTYRFF